MNETDFTLTYLISMPSYDLPTTPLETFELAAAKSSTHCRTCKTKANIILIFHICDMQIIFQNKCGICATLRLSVYLEFNLSVFHCLNKLAMMRLLAKVPTWVYSV